MSPIIGDIDALPAGMRLVATVGVFDGVHLGHVHVLDRLRELASEVAATPVAITFEPHPQAVITGRPPELICDPVERLGRIEGAGVADIVVQRFDEAFRSQTAEQFLERLARGRDLAGLVMSHESAFGRDRKGTVEAVQRLAARDGWRLVEVDTLEIDGAPVSSSRIRGAIQAGDLGSAERLLGRGYAVSGRLRRADEAARTLVSHVPVVLPPAGRFRVSLSVDVLQDGTGNDETPPGHPGTATVYADGITVDGCGLPDDAEVRMMFLGGLAD